jgi:hypothetical protein
LEELLRKGREEVNRQEGIKERTVKEASRKIGREHLKERP